jgi:hypothetical protein
VIPASVLRRDPDLPTARHWFENVRDKLFLPFVTMKLAGLSFALSI